MKTQSLFIYDGRDAAMILEIIYVVSSLAEPAPPEKRFSRGAGSIERKLHLPS